MKINWHEWHSDITTHVPYESRANVKYIRESKAKNRVYVGFYVGPKLALFFNPLTRKWEQCD